MNANDTLGYTGAVEDQVTGGCLLGNGYRTYIPALMRFNAPDDFSPFGGGGMNPFAYCMADPINNSDPTGHVPFGKVGNFMRRAFSRFRRSARDVDAELGDAPIAVDRAEASTSGSRSAPDPAALISSGPWPAHPYESDHAAPHFSISLGEGKPLLGYSSMTLTSYAVDKGAVIPLEPPLSLHAGGTVTTPPVDLGRLPYDGLTHHANVDLTFRLEPYAGGVPGEMRLRVRTYAQDVARWNGGEDYRGPADWRVGIVGGYPQALGGDDVRTTEPKITFSGLAGIYAPVTTSRLIRFNPRIMESPAIPFTIVSRVPRH